MLKNCLLLTLALSFVLSPSLGHSQLFMPGQKDPNRIIDQPKAMVMTPGQKNPNRIIDQPKAMVMTPGQDDPNKIIDPPRNARTETKERDTSIPPTKGVIHVRFEGEKEEKGKDLSIPPTKGVIHVRFEGEQEEVVLNGQLLTVAMRTLSGIPHSVELNERTLLAGVGLVLTGVTIAVLSRNPAYLRAMSVVPPVSFQDDNSITVPRAPSDYSIEDARALSELSNEEIKSLLEEGLVDAELVEYATQVGLSIFFTQYQTYLSSCPNPNLCS